MIWFYRIVLIFAFPFVLLGALFLKKLRKGLVGRIGLTQRLRARLNQDSTEKPRFWFHVSSAGELEQAIPLMSGLKRESPSCFIALTYFSPSAEKAIHLEIKRREKANTQLCWDFADFSPFDFCWSIRAFISYLNPRALILIQRELWPEMIYEVSRRKIPAYLWAAFLDSKQSHLSLIHQWALNRLTSIGTVDEQTANTLRSLTHCPIQILGDPRFERILERKTKYQAGLPGKGFFESQTIWIGASLWDEDFWVVLPSLKGLLMNYPNLRVLLVPHEPTQKRVHLWKRELQKQNIPIRLWSHWLGAPDDTSHLIVDQVGLLAELYSIGSLAFVGGSFKDKVHNVLEPAIYGIPILTGPKISNSFEAKELQSRNILRVVHNDHELSAAVREIIDTPQKTAVQKKQFKDFENEHSNVSLQYLKTLLDQ